MTENNESTAPTPDTAGSPEVPDQVAEKPAKKAAAKKAAAKAPKEPKEPKEPKAPKPDMKPVGFVMTRAEIDAVDASAKVRGNSRSAELRLLVRHGLANSGSVGEFFTANEED